MQPCTHASIRPSTQAVHEFLHGRLVGEGNLLRHLELLGYRLQYKQSPLAEYPYAVTNLAVDLRDGLRLVRLAELLAGEGAGAAAGGQWMRPGVRRRAGVQAAPMFSNTANGASIDLSRTTNHTKPVTLQQPTNQPTTPTKHQTPPPSRIASGSRPTAAP